MEMDPDKINDADRQIEAKIYDIGSAYAESNASQKVENKKRAENRKKIAEIGMRTDAYQVGVKIVKDLTPAEIKDFMRDLQLTVKVLSKRQADLFPDEVLKREVKAQREKEKKAKKPRTKDELDAASDANPRSNPKRGGAAKKAVENLNRAPLSTDGEQADGDAALNGLLPATKAAQADAEKLSQSAQAEAARVAALGSEA